MWAVNMVKKLKGACHASFLHRAGTVSSETKVQNIFQSDDDATDRESEMEELRAPKINEKEDKKFDYSLFIT